MQSEKKAQPSIATTTYIEVAEETRTKKVGVAAPTPRRWMVDGGRWRKGSRYRWLSSGGAVPKGSPAEGGGRLTEVGWKCLTSF